MLYGGIDLLRHVLALNVIFSHMVSSRYSPDTLEAMQAVRDVINLSVLGFAMIAGCFFNPRRVPENVTAFSKLVLARARRLLIPFFLFSVGYAVMLHFLGKGHFSTHIQGIMTLLPSAGHLYYLPLLFYMDIFLALVVRVTRALPRKTVVFTVLYCALALYCVSLETGFTVGSDLRMYPMYFLAFVTGAILKEGLEGGWGAKFAVAVVTVCFVFGFDEVKFWKMGAAVILVSGALWASRRFPQKLNRRFPGASGIYLLHTPVLNFGMSTALQAVGIVEVANVLLALLLTYAVALSATLSWRRLFPEKSYLLLE